MAFRGKLALFAACALTVSMWATFLLYDPHVPTGPPITPDGRFESGEQGWTGWSVHARRDAGAGHDGSTAVRLDPGPPGDGVLRTVVPVPPSTHVRLSFRFRAEGLVLDDRPGSCAGLNVVMRDAAGVAHWEDAHIVTLSRSSYRWTHYVRGFDVPAYARTIHITAFNHMRSGTLFVDDLLLEPARRVSWFRAVEAVFAVSWAVLLACNVVAAGLFRTATGRLTVVCVLLIAAAAAAPAGFYRAALERQAVWIARWSASAVPVVPSAASSGSTAPAQPSPPRPPAPAPRPVSPPAPPAADAAERLGDDVVRVKKAGHALGFAVLGALATLLPRRLPWWRSVFPYVVVFASATEAVQFLVPRRTAQLEDIGIDIAGALAGAAITILARAVVARRRRT